MLGFGTHPLGERYLCLIWTQVSFGTKTMYQGLVNKPQQGYQVQSGTDLFARYDL